MKTFNNLKEMKPYYNSETNTYEFLENGESIDVEFTFNVDIKSHIKAGDIYAWDITAQYVTARDIDARNMTAWEFNARDISYYAVCIAYKEITCGSIVGRRENSFHYCLDGKITINEYKTIIIDGKEIRISKYKYEELKKQLTD